METMLCLHCGKEIPIIASKCPWCHSSTLASQERYMNLAGPVYVIVFLFFGGFFIFNSWCSHCSDVAAKKARIKVDENWSNTSAVYPAVKKLIRHNFGMPYKRDGIQFLDTEYIVEATGYTRRSAPQEHTLGG